MAVGQSVLRVFGAFLVLIQKVSFFAFSTEIEFFENEAIFHLRRNAGIILSELFVSFEKSLISHYELFLLNGSKEGKDLVQIFVLVF
ncbi:MAG: hypothetical protein DHS20C13_26630 [Thermodesulfobacteriota bacterium]|nr:MAG: hypothetical protein DHS20C13_26630 [Thermodesulfobacteriota bacterium]